MARIIPARSADAAREAAAVLAAGGLVVLPTDTVYGVGARLDRPDAVSRIFEVKGRDRSKPLPILVADLTSARRLAAFPPEASKIVGEAWPGPLTAVLERTEAARALDLGGDGTSIGLRIPNHPVALALLREAGPLAVTSANPSGGETRGTVDEIRAVLGERVDLYLDDGPLIGRPSRVISFLGGVRVLRE